MGAGALLVTSLLSESLVFLELYQELLEKQLGATMWGFWGNFFRACLVCQLPHSNPFDWASPFIPRRGAPSFQVQFDEMTMRQ